MPWWLWLIVAVLVGIVEVTTFTFVLLWIAIAGLVTTLFSLAVPSPVAQIVIFAALSVILIVATRPLARKWKAQRTLATREDTLVGAEGRVVAEATVGKNAVVRVRGDLWSAVSDLPLQMGQRVRVTASSTTLLTVVPIEEA